MFRYCCGHNSRPQQTHSSEPFDPSWVLNKGPEILDHFFILLLLLLIIK